MEGRRNLCAMLPLPLFEKVGEEREKSGLTNSEYISQVLEEYYRMKENGGANMAKDTGKERTLAFQISTDLFKRVKAHLERETQRTGHRLTQREFVIGLIEQAITESERKAASTRTESAEESEQMAEEEQGQEEGAVAPREDADSDGSIQPPEEN